MALNSVLTLSGLGVRGLLAAGKLPWGQLKEIAEQRWCLGTPCTGRQCWHRAVTGSPVGHQLHKATRGSAALLPTDTLGEALHVRVLPWALVPVQTSPFTAAWPSGLGLGSGSGQRLLLKCEFGARSFHALVSVSFLGFSRRQRGITCRPGGNMLSCHSFLPQPSMLNGLFFAVTLRGSLILMVTGKAEARQGACRARKSCLGTSAP